MAQPASTAIRTIDSVPQAGAAYIFTRTGGTWTQQAYVKASNTGKADEGDTAGDGDQFGFSIALSGDGSTAAVGAITEDSAAQESTAISATTPRSRPVR